MPLKGAVLRNSLETIKIVRQLWAVFRKGLETLKILAYSKVCFFFWKTDPCCVILAGPCLNVSSYSIDRKKSNSALKSWRIRRSIFFSGKQSLVL